MTITRAPNLSLGGLSFTLAQKDGVRPWTETWEPSTPQDLEPFREFVPFGNFGMGSSYPTINPNQYDYSNGIDTEEWGVLKPGRKQYPGSNLAGAYATTMETMRTTVASTSFGWTTSGALTGSTSAVASTSSWSNPTYVANQDSSYASVSTGDSSFDNSEYLTITGFGLTGVTAGAVTGVEIEVYGYHTGNYRYGNTSPVLRCYLIKGGVIQTSYTEDQILPIGSQGAVHYGGSGTLWGTTLTNADVQAANFGIALRVIDGGGTGDFTSYVGWARIKVYASSGTVRYLYVGTTYSSVIGGVMVFKFNLTQMGTTSQFTGQGAFWAAPTNAEVTDFAVLRDFRTTRNPTTAISDVALVCFGSDLSMRQISSVNYNAADTYLAGAHTAYAYLAQVLPTLTNTEVRVWRTAASDPATSETAGMFTTLQHSALQTTPAVDYTAVAAWGPPATPYRVGSWWSDITAIARFQLGLAVGKPEGVYLFDPNSIPQLILSLESQQSPLNCRGMLTFGSQLIVPTASDLYALPAPRGEASIGLQSLQSNSSPVTGFPTALTSWGRYLFVSFYNGQDSWIVKMKRTTYERSGHPFVFYPVVKVPNRMVRAIKVVDDGNANPNFYLCYPKENYLGSDGGDMLAFIQIAGPDTPEYHSGGEWYSTRFGTVGLVTRIERISVLGIDCDASNYWTCSVAWDGDIFGNTFTSYGTVTTSGSVTQLSPTPGTYDTGYIYQIKLSPTIANTLKCPRLVSPGYQDQTGIVVEGQRQPRSVHRIKFVCAASDRTGNSFAGRSSYTAKQLFDTWSGYIGSTNLANFIAPDAFGTGVTKQCIIESVSYVEDERDAEKTPTRMIQVGVRIIGE